jgi:serine/threonine-protein kinase
MSQERFIRCKHCGLPHEASRTQCPVTGVALEPRRPRSVPPPPPSGEEKFHKPPRPSGRPEQEETPSVARFYGSLIEGKYRIDELIGKGGMGAVYRAEHVRLAKPCAIKVLLRGHAPGSPQERRFYREARVAATMGHPNITEVFDVGTLDDGTPFLAMELLEGETLADRIKLEGALPIDDVVGFAEQILSGLAAAHAKGIVHRDLKPENVFLVRKPGKDEVIAKLLDFGISKNLVSEDTLSLTQTGAVVGTPFYLSPEQARGEKHDHRIDLWACGVVMYEALAGRLPFHADNYNALLIKIVSDRPTPPSVYRPSIPPAIESVVMTALAHKADERFQTADDMLVALRLARTATTAKKIHVSMDGETEPSFAQTDEMTLPALRHSQVAGGAPDDPTEISDSFSHHDLRLPKIDDTSK